MTLTRKDFAAFSLILLSLIAFYPELFLAKSASLIGDHLEQHYQWTYILAESVKQFQLPFWTPLVHSGFPLVAEGQVGAFYLPNLILCFLLPIQWAYSYMNVVHFLIAGIGTYLYARQMKLTHSASLVASFV